MVELKPDEFTRALPLYREAGRTFPLISAVIQGKQRGQVFADDRTLPRSALVVTNFGFTYLIEDEQVETLDEGIAVNFSNGDALTPSYFLWYAPPARWQARLEALTPEFVRRRERVRFEFRREMADYLENPAPTPAGFQIRRMDEELVAKTEKFGLDLGKRFWSSVADFVENGLGVCLMKGDEVVSLCYAAAVIDGLAEVDVVTEPEFRGQGLASVIAEEFIRESLRQGITPTWDCFSANAGSMKLAERLGFAPAYSYTFYSFNVPIKL